MNSMEGMETSDLKICSRLPIHELIKLIRYSSGESEFNKVSEILIDHENSMKSKLDNLVDERDSWKEKERLLERAVISSDLEKFKFEEKWQQSRRECEELKERIKELIENQKLMSNREKRGDEWYMKACEENPEMVRSEHLGSGRTVGEDKEKYRCLEIKFVQMFKEMKGLRLEKAAADQTMKELRGRESEANQVIDELKRQNTEAIQTMDELRRKKSESDKAAELNKKILENWTPRLIKVEKALASMFDVNVEDLANLVKDSENSTGVEEAKHVNFPDSEGNKESFGNVGALGGECTDYANATGMSPGVHSTCTSTGIGLSDLLKKGGGNLVLSSRTKVDGADGFQTFPGAQSGNHPPQVESNDTDIEHESKGLRGSGTHDSDFGSEDRLPITELVMSGAGCSGKMLHSSAAPSVIVDLSDSDDESNSSGGACRTDILSDVGVKEIINEKLVQAPSSQVKKRNTTDWKESSLTSLSPKRRRGAQGSDNDMFPIHSQKGKKVIESTHDKLGSVDNDISVKSVLESSSQPHHSLPSMRTFDSRTPLQELDGVSKNLDGSKDDEVSTDSEDESYSDACMDEYVANLCSQKLSRNWICRADMTKAFQEDTELCMNAVCALHRQQISAEKSARDSNICKSGGFSPIDAISGRALAEYLIAGNPELRLRKSVSEVQQERPDVIRQCRRLASVYQESLFEIYENEEDRFFGPK